MSKIILTEAQLKKFLRTLVSESEASAEANLTPDELALQQLDDALLKFKSAFGQNSGENGQQASTNGYSPRYTQNLTANSAQNNGSTQYGEPSAGGQTYNANSAGDAMKKAVGLVFGNSNGTRGYCARGTYQLAKTFTTGVATKNALYKSSGAGNADSQLYLNKLGGLGYHASYSNNEVSNDNISSVVNNIGQKCAPGDVLVYYTNDGGTGIRKRHTQICVSNNGNATFACDNRNNYNKIFVYGNKLGQTRNKTWTVIQLKPNNFSQTMTIS